MYKINIQNNLKSINEDCHKNNELTKDKEDI